MISFVTVFPELMFSSGLEDVVISTDLNYIDFRISCDDRTAFKTRLYAFNGQVVVSDLSSLIEDFLRDKSEHTVSHVTLSASYEDFDDEYCYISFDVIFCEKHIGRANPPDWLKNNFLTLARNRRLAPGSFINLSWYDVVTGEQHIRVLSSYADADGNRGLHSYNIPHSASPGLMNLFLPLSEIREKILDDTEYPSIILQAVTVQLGERSVNFYIDPTLDGFTPFFYLNSFGIPEHISLARTTTEKTKTEKSTASFGLYSSFYDVSTSKEYDVESGAISPFESVQVEEFLTSPCVRIPLEQDNLFDSDFDNLADILITDYTLELSDSDEKLNAVKFSWRFLSNYCFVSDSLSPGIFNNAFQPPFS